MRKGKGIVKKIITFFLVLSVFLFPIPYSLFPAYAVCSRAADGLHIGDCFGFGDITSLGQATTNLMKPFFSLAVVLVIIYFLLGAFKYLKSGGNKEEVAGARQMITQAILGFMVLMLAFLVLQFILSSLFGKEIVPSVNLFYKKP